MMVPLKAKNKESENSRSDLITAYDCNNAHTQSSYCITKTKKVLI